MLNKKFIDKYKKTKCFKVAKFSENNLKNYKYKKPSEFFSFFWKKYESNVKKLKLNNVYNGTAFGIILCYLFLREQIEIQKMDEDVDVFEVKPDFLINSKSGKEIFLSIKTSGRERWKQADWEAIEYKKTFPKTECVLLMNHEKEVNLAKKKVPHITLDKILYAQSKDLDDLIDLIKK